MKNTNKRYNIYLWDYSDIESYNYDCGDFYESLESGYRVIADYGTLIDATDNEDEAYQIAMKTADNNRGEVSIYDTQERHWFN